MDINNINDINVVESLKDCKCIRKIYVTNFEYAAPVQMKEQINKNKEKLQRWTITL